MPSGDYGNWPRKPPPATSAMRIGRYHIASTVYTIAFAYAGAALPVLILVMLYGRPPGDALTSAELSEEVIRTLVGSVGLVLAIQVTTLIAVLVRKATGIKARGGADDAGSLPEIDAGRRPEFAASRLPPAACRRSPPSSPTTPSQRRRQGAAGGALPHGTDPRFPHSRRGSGRFARI